ncbi:MAG TPA: S8 family serine peptidase, partial [Micromonosporaceae bacterium]|nr:S8 family serine peptidase [Micromonosporaceae bacterium]
MTFGTRTRRLAVLGLATVVATVVASAAVSGPASAAGGEIRHAGGPTAVAGSYIVVLKDGVRASAQGLTARYGGAVGFTYTAALRGFEVSASEAVARRIAADPSVDYVQQNHVLSLVGTQPNPPSWGLDRIDQRNQPLDSSYTYPNTASNV